MTVLNKAVVDGGSKQMREKDNRTVVAKIFVRFYFSTVSSFPDTSNTVTYFQRLAS